MDEDHILNDKLGNKTQFRRYNQSHHHSLSDDDDSDDYSDSEFDLGTYEAFIKESQDVKISKAFSLIKKKNSEENSYNSEI